MRRREDQAVLHGGPADGRTVHYTTPMPYVMVIATLVPADGTVQPGLTYSDYRIRDNLRRLQAGAYHYDYIPALPSSHDPVAP